MKGGVFGLLDVFVQKELSVRGKRRWWGFEIFRQISGALCRCATVAEAQHSTGPVGLGRYLDCLHLLGTVQGSQQR